MKVISLDDLCQLGRCEHKITVKGLSNEQVLEVLREYFPEVALNSRDNFVINIRKDPAHTRTLLNDIFSVYPRVCIEWHRGDLAEEHLYLSDEKLERLFA